jgi:hypothetical protein
MNRDEIIAALDKDGAEVWTEDDIAGWRLRIEQDEDASINDFDCYGKVEWPGRHSNDYGYHTRPEGFDGSAQKLDTRNGPIWWQPYREGHKVYNSTADRRVVLDLLEMGFSGVVVEELTRCDRGHVHVAELASLWGIDSLENGYLAEVVGDLLSELGVD